MASTFKPLILSLCTLFALPSASRAESQYMVAYVDGERTSASANDMPWVAGDAKLPETARCG